MRLYALAGQRAAALRQYRECVRRLQGELGVPPLEETTALYRAIKEEGAPPLPDEKTGRPTRDGAAASRPAPPPDSPLVGRADEWEALLRAYDAARERGHVAVLEGEAGIGLDDLHWADESSLDLLAYLTRRLASPGGRPLLVLLAWRAEEVPSGHRLRGLLAEARRADAATCMPLGRLDRDAVSELARSEAGGSLLWHLGDRLYGETEGLPLFLSEYLETISRGTLGTDDDAAWALPGGARDILEGRLRSVSETGWQLLTAAAVLAGPLTSTPCVRRAGAAKMRPSEP
jgi:hypothetical protein